MRNSGEKNQPATCTCRVADAISSAMRGSACAPSTSNSTRSSGGPERAGRCPAAGPRVERGTVPVPPQAAPVVCADRAFDEIAESVDGRGGMPITRVAPPAAPKPRYLSRS